MISQTKRSLAIMLSGLSIEEVYRMNEFELDYLLKNLTGKGGKL